jgi:hypothetical protein
MGFSKPVEHFNTSISNRNWILILLITKKHNSQDRRLSIRPHCRCLSPVAETSNGVTRDLRHGSSPEESHFRDQRGSWRRQPWHADNVCRYHRHRPRLHRLPRGPWTISLRSRSALGVAAKAICEPLLFDNKLVQSFPDSDSSVPSVVGFDCNSIRYR